MIFGKKINSCEKQPLLMLVKIVPMKPENFTDKPHPWKFLPTKISVTCFFNLIFWIDPGV